MYKNKNIDGSCNICGKKVKELRLNLIPNVSQRMLAEKMQLQGIDLDKNAIQRIESGQRCIIDIEVIAFAKIFNISIDELFNI